MVTSLTAGLQKITGVLPNNTIENLKSTYIDVVKNPEFHNGDVNQFTDTIKEKFMAVLDEPKSPVIDTSKLS